MKQPQPHDSLADLLNIVAHDLKSPITSVKGFIELVQSAGPLNEKQQRFTERALVGLEQMSNLVEHLLDIAWIDAEKPLELHAVDLGRLIDHAVMMMEMTAAHNAVTIHVNLPPDLGTVLGDERRLGQAVNNLVSNALKYNQKGGEVWITATGDHDTVQVVVKDSGRGIKIEDQPRVFERFFRSESSRSPRIEGTGLGLSIVKAVIERHQGRIWLESTPGVSSTFTVMLPRHPRDSEGKGSTVELIHLDVQQAESADPVNVNGSGEVKDAVDDDTQESRHFDHLDRGQEYL